MATGDGWEFWIDDHGAVRLIMVAEPDFHAAERIALDRTEGGRTISFQEIPARVNEMMGLQREGVVEWISTDRRNELKPRGTTRGGEYDTNGR